MSKALYVLFAVDMPWDASMSVGVGVAKQCATEVDVLVFGSRNTAEQLAVLSGVNTVIYADASVYAHGLAEPCAEVIAAQGKSYDVVLMPSNAVGKNILPRVSGLLNRVMLSDVMAIEADAWVRPIYAGNAVERVRVTGPYIMTYRATCFSPMTSTQASCTIEHLTDSPTNTKSEWMSIRSHPSARPDLTDAKIVVAGGRGLKSKEQFQLIEQLADCLGAAVGASRAAVDAGFVPNECQVGQTGKVVAPDLYLAIGISGAIQHIAGMKSSKVIVAINHDPDAPIFKIADYGWVTDLFEAIPALEKALQK